MSLDCDGTGRIQVTRQNPVYKLTDIVRSLSSNTVSIGDYYTRVRERERYEEMCYSNRKCKSLEIFSIQIHIYLCICIEFSSV